MPLGDFTAAGFPPSSFNGAMFPHVNSGLTGCKRSMNGNIHAAGKFEVSNMAPNQKKARLGEMNGLHQAEVVNNSNVSSCAPPVYGHYGYIPNYQESEETAKIQYTVAEDAPLSSASAQVDLTSMHTDVSQTMDTDMDTNEEDSHRTESSQDARNGYLTTETPRSFDSHPVCVYEHRTNCHARGCREYLYEDMFLGYHGL